MKKNTAIVILTLITILILLNCINATDITNSSESSTLNQSINITNPSNSTIYRANEILVRFKSPNSSNTSLEEISRNIHQKVGSTVLKEFNEIKGLQLVKIPDNMTLDEALAIYTQNENVIYAEPNYICKNQSIPNDPYYDYQWGLNNINAPSAWNITTGSKNVIIAVVDSGIDINHPDLRYNIWVNPGEIPGNNIDDDGNGFIDDVYGWNFADNDNNVTDSNGHGTHVAGIIAASGNNTQGITGVIWNATILPLKFIDKNGDGYVSDAVSAISYAIKIGAFIINCSWSGSTYSQTLKNVIESSSALVVCASGNDISRADTDVTPNYPASYDSNNVISVTATDMADNLCYFASYGVNSVDVAAPGSSIYSTLPGSSYGYMSGTSMATAYVSGLAGLIKSLRPDLNNIQVKNVILNNVDIIDSLTGKILTGGRINAYRSLTNIITIYTKNDDSQAIYSYNSSSIDLKTEGNGIISTDEINSPLENTALPLASKNNNSKASKIPYEIYLFFGLLIAIVAGLLYINRAKIL